MLGRSLSAIVRILKESNRSTQPLDLFSVRLIEAFSIFVDDLTLLSKIFNYFTIYRFPAAKLTFLIRKATAIIFLSIEAISGKPEKWKQSPGEDFIETVRNDLLTRNLDVLISPSKDYLAFIHPMRAALRFLFANESDSVLAAQKSFRYFPRECSQYLIRSWRNLRAPYRNKVLSALPRKLRHVGDDTCHALWCSLFATHDALLTDQTVSATAEFLSQMATDLLLSRHKKPMSDIVMLSNFLLRWPGPAAATFLQNLTETEKAAYLNANQSAIPQIDKVLPGWAAGFQPETRPPPDELPEDPEEALPTEDSDIQAAFEKFVALGSVNLVRKLLQLAADRRVAIDISRIDFPAKLIPVIASALARSQPNTFPPLEAVERLRTAWRPLALAALPDGSFLSQYSEKLHKRTILAICSVIGSLNFDVDILKKLAIDAFLSSSTAHRFYLTVTFLEIALSFSPPPPDFIASFLTQINENFELLLPSLLTRLLSIVAQNAPPSAQFAQIANSILPFCGAKTVAAGWVHRVLLAFSATPGLISVEYLTQISDLLQSFLSSVMPSLYLTGLRLFAQAAISAPLERIVVGLRVPIDILADRFIYMSAQPSIAEAESRAVAALLSRQGVPTLHTQLFRHMPLRFAIPPGSVGYRDAGQFWPLVLPLLGKDAVSRKIAAYCDGIASCPFLGQIAARLIKEKLSKSPEKQRQQIITDSFKNWSDNVAKQRGRIKAEEAKWWIDLSTQFGLAETVKSEIQKSVR
jgi:hypothetical protein